MSSCFLLKSIDVLKFTDVYNYPQMMFSIYPNIIYFIITNKINMINKSLNIMNNCK